MADADLSSFFTPRNIALVGASDRSAWSAMVYYCFELYDHKGKLFAVNRGGKSAHGLPGYTSCTEIEDRVDAAFIYVPAGAVVEALHDAAAAGIRNAVIISSGFAETGAEGAAMQEDVVRTVRELGIRFMGPNSLGFANLAHDSVMTSVKTRKPVRTGHLAIISQSGALVNEMGKVAHCNGIGLAFLGATGNEAGLTITDLLGYLVDDDAVSAICIYSEGIRDHARFMAAATRAREARKPVVMLKLGRSAISGAIAEAHTGSLIGDDGVFDAMCQRTGVIRCASIEEVIATADLLGRIGPIDPPRLALSSISGGACALMADLADEHGLTVEPFTQETQDALRKVLPAFAATLNPLDVTGALVQQPEVWQDVIPIMARNANTGLAIVCQPIPNVDTEIESLTPSIRAIVAGFRAANQPAVIVDLSVQTRSKEQLELIGEIGVDVPVQGVGLVGVVDAGQVQDVGDSEAGVFLGEGLVVDRGRRQAAEPVDGGDVDGARRLLGDVVEVADSATPQVGGVGVGTAGDHRADPDLPVDELGVAVGRVGVPRGQPVGPVVDLDAAGPGLERILD